METACVGTASLGTIHVLGTCIIIQVTQLHTLHISKRCVMEIVLTFPTSAGSSHFNIDCLEGLC